jgi:Lipocalin-like domain
MDVVWRVAVLMLVLTTLSACGDKASAPDPAELADTWTATKAEYVSKTTSAEVDIVAAGGTASLDANGRFEYVETPSGGTPESTHGDWSASADVMTMTVDGLSGNRQFDLYFSGNTLRLTGGDVLYDFGPGGGLQEADQNLELRR